MTSLDRPPTGQRPTRLIIDRQAIAGNASRICRHLSPSTRLMAVVKANGYGHGSIESARAALSGGASFLGVATISEACELRDAGFDAPVLVLGSSDPLESLVAARMDIAIGVGDNVQADRLFTLLEAAPPARPLQVHLKVDTGMRRFGVAPEVVPHLARRISEHATMQLSGIYSHFAESDAASPDLLDHQLDVFRTVLQAVDSAGIERGIAHISNSAALLRNRNADLDMVRAGICLYGISPSGHVPLFDGMEPALEWRATVQHITNLWPGDRTGYGGTYAASGHERLALLPVGYADGYARQFSNRGWVGYQGQQLPIRGRVSMDQCTAGIPADLPLSVGDEVTIIGRPASGAPDANQLGDIIDTIGYEIVSRISRRVPVEYR